MRRTKTHTTPTERKLIKLLSQPEGCTRNELCARMGWQRTTLATQLTKLKKLGLQARSDVVQERRYRLVK